MRPLAALLVLLVAGSFSAGQEPATAPTTTTATAPAPPPTVTWHGDYKDAVAQARKRSVLLVVVYLDADAPASETFQEKTLSDQSTRELLAHFAAVRLDARRDPGKARLARTGAGEAPLTQVLTAKGELLDSIAGFIGPGGLRKRLGKALAWQEAVTSRPFDPAARWRAVQARLALSTRHQAVKDIDVLLKTAPGKLPKGTTRAGLRLARGLALRSADPPRAEKDLQEAARLGAKDVRVGGQALLELADLSFRADRGQRAWDYCVMYIERFPRGPGIGRAWYTKAKVELLSLHDTPKAAATLEAFLDRHSDDPWAVKARDMLDRIERARKGRAAPAKPAGKSKPATAPAKGRTRTHVRIPDGT